MVLAQRSSLISAVLKFGAATDENPFMRVNTLITELISWLQDEASSLKRRISELTLRSILPRSQAETESCSVQWSKFSMFLCLEGGTVDGNAEDRIPKQNPAADCGADR